MDSCIPVRGIDDEFNRKGLISDQGEKKAAFFVLQKAYRKKAVGRADSERTIRTSDHASAARRHCRWDNQMQSR